MQLDATLEDANCALVRSAVDPDGTRFYAQYDVSLWLNVYVL